MIAPAFDEKEILCDVCGCDDLEFAFFARDRNREVGEREFSIFKCKKCHVGITLPRLSATELRQYYPREYYSLDTNRALEAATRRYNQTRIRRIRRHAAGGTLLDIGAGTGMFLKTATENGFEAGGLEISEEAAAFGRAAWGVTIRQGNVLETSLPAGEYDVVTVGHVFEHLPAPLPAAKRLASLLKTGGLLVIAVPNFASMQARLFRSQWFHLDVPRHLFHYTPSALMALVRSVGLRVVEINFHSAEHNWAGVLGSVMKLSRPGESSFHKLIRKVVGMPLARACAALEDALHRGGTFELYARKQ